MTCSWRALLIATATLVLLLLPHVTLDWLRLYPMLLALCVFCMFFGSLFTGMPLVERIARMMRSDMPPQAVAYCRRVTQAWCILLLVNASISLYTALAASYRVWTLYNGVIVYFLFGAMFAGEYLLRLHLHRKWAAA